jgi:hypothetical protein
MGMADIRFSAISRAPNDKFILAPGGIVGLRNIFVA